MPKDKHHPFKPNNSKKKVIDVARDLAVAGMSARMFDKYDKPADVATYCIEVAKNILDYDANIDVDDDDTRG